MSEITLPYVKGLWASHFEFGGRDFFCTKFDILLNQQIRPVLNSVQGDPMRVQNAAIEYADSSIYPDLYFRLSTLVYRVISRQGYFRDLDHCIIELKTA